MRDGSPNDSTLSYATAGLPPPPSGRQSPFAFASVVVGIFSIGWQLPAFFKLDVLPVWFAGRIYVGIASSGLSAVLAYAAIHHRPRRHHTSIIAAALAVVAIYLSLHAPFPF
jgi:hypothetical protein